MMNKKVLLGSMIVLVALGTIGCKDEEDPNPGGSVTVAPSAINVQFTSNVEATLTFEKASTAQTVFNVRLTDQYEVVTEYKGNENSPINLEKIPKGKIYTIEMAGGTATSMGDYGIKSSAILASANTDKNNMVRIDMLNAINTARATSRLCGTKQMNAVSPLNWDDKLEQAAEIHTIDMHDNNFFAHTSATDNSDPGERVTRVGYTWSWYGENIYKGGTKAEEAVSWWLTSPPHCENIMNPDFKEIGSSNKGAYWTQVFGTSR